jgi:Arc/MetJ family transcription regulator
LKTSIILKDDILEEAIKATNIKEKTTLIHLGLEELIRKAARKRLARLAGSKKDFSVAKRR